MFHLTSDVQYVLTSYTVCTSHIAPEPREEGKGVKINIPTLSAKTQCCRETRSFLTGSLPLQTLCAALALPCEDQLRPFPHPCGLSR